MSGSLGTPQNSGGNGLTAPDHRQILKALYPNPGVIDGLKVTANTGLTYHVAAGVGVSQRSGSDGSRLFYFAGGDTPAVSAGDGSNPRIDSIWVKCDDPTMDADSVSVHVGVTQGTPSSSPVAPSIPAGCTRLADFRVSAGSANLSSGASDAGGTEYVSPYGSGGGILTELSQSNTIKGVWEDNMWHQIASMNFSVYTKRNIQINYNATSSTGDGNNYTNEGSYYIQVRVDGQIINKIDHGDGVPSPGLCDEIFSNRYYWTSQLSYNLKVNPGTHLVAVWVTGNKTDRTYPVDIFNRYYNVIDLGVAS